jgi:hypothetical protein
LRIGWARCSRATRRLEAQLLAPLAVEEFPPDGDGERGIVAAAGADHNGCDAQLAVLFDENGATGTRWMGVTVVEPDGDWPIGAQQAAAHVGEQLIATIGWIGGVDERLARFAGTHVRYGRGFECQLSCENDCSYVLVKSG